MLKLIFARTPLNTYSDTGWQGIYVPVRSDPERGSLQYPDRIDKLEIGRAIGKPQN